MERTELLKNIIKDKDAVIKHYEHRIYELETCLKHWQEADKEGEER